MRQHSCPLSSVRSVVALLVVALVAIATPARAQRCVRSGCLPEERDARGCCPARPAPQEGTTGGSGGQRGRRDPHRPAQPEPTCLPGQVQNQDTENHCCWPNQVWSRQQRQCLGQPACPNGRASSNNTCRCPSGMTDQGDARGYCCWPGQVYVPSRSECVGQPQCPPRFAPSRGTCVAPPESCADGMEQSGQTAYQCCWPGQTWDSARGECGGTPTCGEGWARSGARCVANPSSCAPGQLASAETSGQCCWPGQRWDGAAGACVGAPACTRNGWARSGRQCIPPAESCEVGRVASAETQNQCCWPGQRWDEEIGACSGTPSCAEAWTVARNTCIPYATACPDGQVMDEATRGQCCWPGQAWNPTAGACQGRPTCLAGWAPAGMECVPPPAGCLEHQVTSAVTRGQCCWASQTWDVEVGQCAGVPECPPGYWHDDRDCRPLPTECAPGRAASQVTRGQCCWPGQEGRRAGGSGPTSTPAQGDLVVGQRIEGNTASRSDSVTPGCGSRAGSPDERWTFTPSTSAVYTFDIESSYDGVLAMYEGGTEIACNDDFGDTRHSRIVRHLEAGHTYELAVDGYQGNSGSYHLEVSGPPGGAAADFEVVEDGAGSYVCVGRPSSCPHNATATASGCDVIPDEVLEARARGRREFTVMIRAEIGAGSADYFPAWEGGQFFAGASAEAWGTVPVLRDSDGAALTGPLFGGRISVHDSVDAPEDSYEVSLLANAGINYGPLGVGGSARMDLIGAGQRYEALEGTLGLFVGLFHAGRMLNRGEDEVGFLATFHWLPDVYEQDSLANIEVALAISFADFLQANIRVRYDEMLGEYRNLFMFFLGAGINLP